MKTYACGACLLRVIPDEALWPIAESLLSDFNIPKTLHACGYPEAPTHPFEFVLQTFVKRNPKSFQPYMEGRIRTRCGEAPAAWFLRHLMDVQAKPDKSAETSTPLGVQTRSMKKRKRESA